MKRGSIYRETQNRLRNSIREHGLRPGDRLPSEAKLADELEVSRLSLREATRSLQTLGVIEARPGDGLYVAEFSFRPIIEQLPYGLAQPGTALEELLVAREAMESGLMYAMSQLRDEEAPALAQCAELAKQMTEREQHDQPFADLDRAFHLSLYRPLHNPLVDNLIELFWELFVRLGDAIPGSPERNRGTAHLAIIQALQRGNPQDATARMQEHFADVRRRAALLHRNTTNDLADNRPADR